MKTTDITAVPSVTTLSVCLKAEEKSKSAVLTAIKNSSKEPDISDWKHCLYGGAFLR